MTELANRLNADEQLVFIHIPRTAGLTFRSIVANHFSIDETYPNPDEWWWPRRERKSTLARYRLFNGHYVHSIGSVLAKPRFVTMLRDPVERTISTFHHVKSKPLALLHGLVARRDMTLQEFVENPVTASVYANWQAGFIGSISLNALNNHQKRLDRNLSRHVRSVQSFFPSVGPQLAAERLNGFAMVGLSERFRASILMLDYVFGWRPTGQFQSLNISSERTQRADLSASTVDAILATNREDTELYYHAVSIFDRRFEQMCASLLEEFGEARHARLALPLPLDEIQALLQKRYRKSRLDEKFERQPSFELDMKAAIVGDGWHTPEPLGDGRFGRWTGPGTLTTLEVGLAPAAAYAVEFEVMHAIAPDVLESFELFVNDERIELQASSPMNRRGIVYSGGISGANIAGHGGAATLKWNLRRTTKAREFDPSNEDPRQLGLLLGGVRIAPLVREASESSSRDEDTLSASHDESLTAEESPCQREPQVEPEQER